MYYVHYISYFIDWKLVGGDIFVIFVESMGN